jgi:hypothetical protein
MYDIINVFEGIEVVARRSRGEYQWFGFDKLPDVIRRQKRLGPLDCSLCTDEDRDDSYEADQDDFKTESKVRLVKSDEILFDKMLARNSLNLSNQKHVLEMPDHLQCSIGLSIWGINFRLFASLCRKFLPSSHPNHLVYSLP